MLLDSDGSDYESAANEDASKVSEQSFVLPLIVTN